MYSNRVIKYIKSTYGNGERYLVAALVICWVINAVASFMDWDVLYNLFSPITALCGISLMAVGISKVGKYWISGFYFLMGIFFWVISDSLVIVYSYFLPNNPYLVAIADALYLAPNYVFGIAIFMYMNSDFRKNERLALYISVVTIIIVGLYVIIGYAGYDFGLAYYTSDYGVSSVAYFIGVGFTGSMMLVHLLIRGFHDTNKAVKAILAALLIYNILEFRYGYYIALSMDPEAPALDVIYLSCVLAFALSFRDPSIND